MPLRKEATFELDGLYLGYFPDWELKRLLGVGFLPPITVPDLKRLDFTKYV